MIQAKNHDCGQCATALAVAAAIRAGQTRLNDAKDKIAEPARYPQHADLGKGQSGSASKRHA
jgi:hypothetical protein